jgi:NADPH-dependent curcumin reductase CurA
MSADPVTPEPVVFRSREVRLVRRPTGMPDPADFAVVDVDVPGPSAGHVLVRNTWMSVDPYMRGRMDDAPSYVEPFALGEPLDGAAVGTVVQSADPAVAVGTIVVHDAGWREFAVLAAAAVRPIDTTLAPPEVFLGSLGMPGLTAYVALTRIAPVGPGDVVLVSGAAGAVGTVAGCVARARGAARVIGIAGGGEKCRRLVDGLGFDAALDHRAGDLTTQVAGAAPTGIDVYLDNVGGEPLRAALANIAPRGRIALCGAISGYIATTPPPGPDNLILAITRQVSLRGFLVGDHIDLYDEFRCRAATWLRSGALPAVQTVRFGIDSAVDAFIGLLSGANVGKMLVRLEGTP